MHTEIDKPDNTFEETLRKSVAETVNSDVDTVPPWDNDIIVRLMNYEKRARQEPMGSRTRQVILSGNRFLGRE